MKYDDWFDEDATDDFVDEAYDKFMAESYNICVAYDWYFPEEVLSWFEELASFHVLLGEHPIAAEDKVVEEYGLSQSPWYFYHMSGGIKRWNASPKKEKPSTPTNEPGGTMVVEIRTAGSVHTVNLAPGESTEISTPPGKTIFVSNISQA